MSVPEAVAGSEFLKIFGHGVIQKWHCEMVRSRSF
jgi:hypothetical protein